MAPKKRTSSGTVKTAFQKIRDLTPNETISITGKVVTKTGSIFLGCETIIFLSLVYFEPQYVVAILCLIVLYTFSEVSEFSFQGQASLVRPGHG